MKKKITIVCVILLIFLSACSGKSNKAEKGTSQSQENVLVIEGIKIDIEKQELLDKVVDNKKQKLYTFTISGENVSSSKKGIGAIDFLLEMKDGKEVKLDDSLAVFGEELKPKEKVKGTVSFVIDEKESATALIYKPGDKKLAAWDVTK